MEEWQEILLSLLRHSDVCRRWFAANYLFCNPNRFYQYLLECPIMEVRACFSSTIVALAKLSAPDPPLSLSELNAWSSEGYGYSVDLVGPLSRHLISGCYSLLVSLDSTNRNIQQLFNVFHCYVKGGLPERQLLLNLRIHNKLINLILEDGSFMRGQFNEPAPLHTIVSVLICSTDLTPIRQTCTGLTGDAVPQIPTLPNSFPIIQHTIELETRNLLTADNYSYLRKLLEDPETVEKEEVLLLVRHICWENARATKMVLLELLYHIGTVHSVDMKSYLFLLLHVSLLPDSWQKKR
eukprot:sb/3467507/